MCLLQIRKSEAQREQISKVILKQVVKHEFLSLANCSYKPWGITWPIYLFYKATFMSKTLF